MFKFHSLFKVITVLVLLLLPTLGMACLWDQDTIKMERARFPSTLELITGKFLRHSPEFYQWRIQDRLKRLEQEPNNLQLLDDLAVAYDKTNQQQKAIDTGHRADRLQPNRYETLANLGTFYIHAGQLTEGLKYINRAIEINPNAHFGREKYQKYLVEYLIGQRKTNPQKLPLSDVMIPENPTTEISQVRSTFATFLALQEKPSSDGHTRDFRPEAIKGILGIMKFGKHDSPIILEALGSCLADAESYPKMDAKLLSARAYIKASLETTLPEAKLKYQAIATEVLEMQQPNVTVAELEKQLQAEIAEADEWYKTLHEREKKWIQDGLNPEAEFDKLYTQEPATSAPFEGVVPEMARQLGTDQFTIQAIIALVILFLGVVVTCYAAWRVFKWYTK